MIVSVMYQVGAGQHFDLDYYMKSHMPLVRSLWGTTGLKGTQVLKGVGSPTGGEAAFHIIALLDFETLDAFKAGAAKHGKAVLGDIVNFTDVEPTLQFNEALPD